jgi:hypothetical protein
MLSLRPIQAISDEETTRSFVIITRSQPKTFFTFNTTTYDIYLADIERLFNNGYVEYQGEKNADPAYFGHIRFNHFWGSFRYFASACNNLHPHEAEELYDEIASSSLIINTIHK